MIREEKSSLKENFKVATATEPPTDALFRALRSVNVDPDLAYEAAEANRRQAGENVIATIDSQITEVRTAITEVRTELKAEIAEVKAAI